MNMPVGRGYDFNPAQEKCWELASVINEAFPMSKNGKPFRVARTEYNEGRGYYVRVYDRCGIISISNYYPDKVEWEKIIEYCKTISSNKEREVNRINNNIEKFNSIRAKLTEDEQFILGIHPNQDTFFWLTKEKLSKDELSFVEGVREKWIDIGEWK